MQSINYEKAINIIFPQVCGICGKINSNSLCKKCEILLKHQAEFAVQKVENKNFEKLIYIFNYNGIIRKMILDYKFKDKSYLYRTFVNFLLKNEKIFEILKSYDKIMAVPISKKRMKDRGYNQSLLIAKQISKNTNLELVNNCLFKIKNIIEQSKLTKEDRIKNVQGVYEIKNKQILKDKRLLLVDDIYTTGSTVNECCKMLNIAKPSKIDVLTIAKD